MKYFYSLLVCYVIILPVSAQRTKVHQSVFTRNEATVIFQTQTADIHLNKDDIHYAANRLSEHVDDAKKSTIMKALQWLDNKPGVIKLSELNHKKDRDDYLATSLLVDYVAAKLLTDGLAKVYRKSDNAYQADFEYDTRSTFSEAIPCDFFFVKESKPFFTSHLAPWDTDGVATIGVAPIAQAEDDTTVQLDKENDEEKVFILVEVVAEYPGGPGKLDEYLSTNIKYTKEASRAHAEGIVFVSFIVTRDGHIKDPQVVKGLGYGLDEEALRVVRESGIWIPGKQNGKVVNTKFILPVKFKKPAK